MKKLMLVMALSAMAALAPTEAMAQESDELAVDCEDQYSALHTGAYVPSALELLTCGRSPEAVGARPSINGPYDVGPDNPCFDFPRGSYEAYYCFEEVLASMGY